MRLLKHEVEETKLRAMFASSPDAITVIDLNGNITECNQATLDMLGYSSKEELIGKNGFTLVAKKDRKRAIENLKKVLEQGSMKNIEYTALTKDGREYPAELSASVIKDSSGNPTGFVAITKDITERKRVEEALRESEEKFRKIFESANDCMIYLHGSGRILDVNEKTVEVFGGSKKELLGKHFTKVGIFFPRDIPTVMTAFAKVLASEEPTLNIRVKNKRGQEISLECSASFAKIDGRLAGILVIARDVTERKKAEEELVRLSSAVKMSTDSIVISDLDTKIIDANEATLKMYGTDDKRDLIGKNSFDIIAPEDREKALAGTKEVLKKGCVKGREYQIITKDGGRIPVEMSVAVMKDADGKPIGFVGISRDIIERKKTEQVLRESEEKFRSLVQTIPECVYSAMPNGEILYMSPAVKTIFGYSAEEFQKDKNLWIRLIHEDDKKELLMKLEKLLKKGVPYVHEFRMKRKDGNIVWIRDHANAMLDEKGKRTKISGVIYDITERKRAEEALRKSEEKYRSLVELAPDSIMTFDLNGVITSCNTASTRLSGYSKDELLGKHFSETGPIRAKDVPEYLKMLPSTVRGKVPKPFEVTFHRKNGTPRFGEVRMGLIKEVGKITGIQAIMRDITERKQMEEKLRQYSEHLEELVQKRTEELLESEKRYSALVEEARDGVGILQDGKLVFVNKIASEIYGYSRDELIGLSFEKIVDKRYHQLVMERYMQRLRGEKVPSTYEIEIIAKNGERVPVELSATRINYQGRPADLVIARDIRERKQMEEERLKLEKLATIGELATMVGHDLRNPLQSIENATYYLNNELPRLLPSILISQKAIEMLQVINDSVNYADKIIKDLHDFSATKKPVLKKTNINAIVKETLSQIKAPKNVKLTTKLGHLPKIKADKDMIKRIFLNLAINGMQAMEKGGTLKVSTKKTKGFIEVRFKDTGAGIPKENMKKMFIPFFTTRAKGMGMGLPVCKKFVDAHGGSIHVESEEGKGSTFMIKLPIQQ